MLKAAVFSSRAGLKDITSDSYAGELQLAIRTEAEFLRVACPGSQGGDPTIVAINAGYRGTSSPPVDSLFLGGSEIMATPTRGLRSKGTSTPPPSP